MSQPSDRTYPECGHTSEDCDCDPTDEQERQADEEEALWDNEDADVDDDEAAETRRLLIEMRRYVVHHGILIGECVAWNRLKEMYGIGDEGLER